MASQCFNAPGSSNDGWEFIISKMTDRLHAEERLNTKLKTFVALLCSKSTTLSSQAASSHGKYQSSAMGRRQTKDAMKVYLQHVFNERQHDEAVDMEAALHPREIRDVVEHIFATTAMPNTTTPRPNTAPSSSNASSAGAARRTSRAHDAESLRENCESTLSRVLQEARLRHRSAMPYASDLAPLDIPMPRFVQSHGGAQSSSSADLARNPMTLPCSDVEFSL